MLRMLVKCWKQGYAPPSQDLCQICKLIVVLKWHKPRDVFRIMSNICDGIFFTKTAINPLVRAWYPLKGHTYLNKPAAFSLFKFVCPFSGHQALKG